MRSVDFSIDPILQVDSNSKRNEYEESSWGLNGTDNLTTILEPIV
jgi:hypothetical protein